MKRVNLQEVFKKPLDYSPPTDLKSSTQYPNLNTSEHYQLAHKLSKEKTNIPVKLLPNYEIIDGNEFGQIILITNTNRGQMWYGCGWGYKSIEKVGGPIEETDFKFRVNSEISCAQFADANLIFVSDTSGTIHLYSTAAEIRNPNVYCLFKIAYRPEHYGRIVCQDVSPVNRMEAVTGCSQGSIKVWDMTGGDVVSTKTYRPVHGDSVTGVSFSPNEPSQFTSCSSDRNLLIWDLREAKPIVSRSERNSVGFSTVKWFEKIYVGDDSGRISIGDPRNLSKFIDSVHAFDQRIHRFRFDQLGKRFVTISDSNKFKVYSNLLQTCLQDDTSVDWVRDAFWSEPNRFYVIGWDSTIRNFKLND